MTDNDKVSVIIPVYNAGKFIIDCLDSIKQQNINLEVICINDGSTDDSEKQIKQYCVSNLFVKYIYQDNAGAPAARNKGLEIATGKYVMFFDADDILLPNALKNMINILENKTADIVIGDFNEVDEQNRVLNAVKQKNFILNFHNHWCFAQCPPLPGNKLIRKSILDNSKLKFENLKIGQDLNFYLKLVSFAEKIVLTEQPVMQYRIVTGSISRQYTLKILDICNSIDNVKKYYVEKGIGDKYDKYVSVIELIAYRSQLEKMRNFPNKEDRIKIKNVLWPRIKNCHVPFYKFRKTYYREKIKCILIILRYF